LKKKDKTNLIIVIIVIIVIALLINSGNKKESTLLGEQVLYYNNPVIVKFTSAISDGVVSAYFDNQIYNATISQTGNGSYSVLYDGLKQPGLAKVVVTKGTESEVLVIEVKKPFVKCITDFPISLSKGETKTLTIKTYTPQGDSLDAENIEVVLYDPNNDNSNIAFSKMGNTFTTDYKFEKAGAFIFKIYGKQPSFDTEEYTAIIDVTQPEGVPYIIYIWMGMIGMIILLFIVARLKGMKIGKKK